MDGKEAGMLGGGYNLQGMVLGSNGADDEGKMGAGVCCLHQEEVKGSIRVGRKQEGMSGTCTARSILTLSCRNRRCVVSLRQPVSFTEVNGWNGEGGRAALATTPNAEIMREILCLLRARIETVSATFLVKSKSHRGEPINEQVDELAD